MADYRPLDPTWVHMAKPGASRAAAAAAQDSNVAIRVRDLVVGFGQTLVMNGLDLDVYRGEVLGFVGASGMGKSVLMRTVLGLIKKRRGTIEVFGSDLDALSPDERARVERRFGVMFQQGALFSGMTVKENTKVPLREHLKISDKLADELANIRLNSQAA
jgi:phospholipid/cholesterol/gamma-HCH transport system ATP-binding protein